MSRVTCTSAVAACLVGGQGVVDRCRAGVFGGEPVVDGDDLGGRPPADLRGQVSSLEGVPYYVHAAVKVQHDMAMFDPVDGDLGGWNAAQRGCGHGDLGGQRLRRRELLELSPLLVDVAADGEGGLPQDGVEALPLFGAHGGSPSAGIRLAAPPGGLARANPLLTSRPAGGHYYACRQRGEETSPDQGDPAPGI